jgi:hypothetical protein
MVTAVEITQIRPIFGNVVSIDVIVSLASEIEE